MIQRSLCLCDGKYIGIETIYTVIDGKQINKPEELKRLREKGRNNELFCPCGCGVNFVVVAGENNLREQHFRIKKGSKSERPCSYQEEGIISVNSKIVLKCWLDENVKTSDVETRVPICAIDDTSRKYEFTLLSPKAKVAINYCYEKMNLSSEKMAILDQNSDGIQVIHIIDEKNRNLTEQYPEGLMKVQERQGYCLFLIVATSEYDKGKMMAAFYAQNIDGLWKEVVFSEGRLQDYRIDESGFLYFQNVQISSLMDNKKKLFEDSQKKEKLRRENNLKRIDEEKKLKEKEKAEAEAKRIAFLESLKRENEAILNSIKTEEAENNQWDEAYAVHNRLVQEKQELKRTQDQEKKVRENSLWPVFRENLDKELSQQKEIVIDPSGERWIKCKFCGKKSTTKDFTTYGGKGEVNLGICKDCKQKGCKDDNNSSSQILIKTSNNNEVQVCPKCGGKLKKRDGMYGPFWGCSNYPNCKYTEAIKR